MNEKINIQDLVELLAEKHGLSKKNADSFVKEFFQLVEEGLEKDKYVKIKGLGTFKLIDVESRESVNVNTGERFEIQGHTKVTFTPEPALKDIVNKPFSHFETVPLNDDTVLDDMPLEGDNDDDEEMAEVAVKSDDSLVPSSDALVVADDSPVVPEVSPVVTEEVPVPVAEEVPAPVAEEETKETKETEEAAAEEETKETEESATVEEEINTEAAPPEAAAKGAGDSSTLKYFVGIVVVVVALCAGAIGYLYYPDLLDGKAAEAIPEHIADAEAQAAAIKAAPADSINRKDTTHLAAADTIAGANAGVSQPGGVLAEAPKEAVKQSVPVAKEQKKPEAAPFKPDSVGYIIVGTQTTYTIQEGETLTRVALRFYGTKALWPYIVKHNPGIIKNPDNVPFGTTIKIPKLKKKQ